MLAVFLDQETTGLDASKHSVIEVAFKIVNLTEDRRLADYQRVIQLPVLEWEKRDLASISVNGFTWDRIREGTSIDQVRKEVIELLNLHQIQRGKAVIICQNPAFDRAFFSQIVDVYTQEKHQWPYHWLDLASMFWTKQMHLFQEKKESIPICMNLSKDEIAKYYHLPSEIRPHRAMNGVEHLMLCYEAVVGKTSTISMES